MIKKKEVFKVAKVFDHRTYESAIISGFLRTPYSIGKKSIPPIGGVFAFNTEYNANRWMNRLTLYGQFRVLRCSGTDVRAYRRDYVPKVWLFSNSQEDIIKTLKAFWHGSLWTDNTYNNKPSKGTVYCSSITPLEVR